MKKLILALMIMCLYSISNAQTPEEMKAWENSMTPGKYHKWLASFDGDWDGAVKLWMDPSQPPMAYNIKTKNEMVMNGLYQKSTHSGEMMGKPFEGEGTAGYDNTKKRFVTTWIDNFGSGIMQMEGELSSDDKIMITVGTMSDPMSGQDIKVKQVLTYISEDRHLFEMFMMMGETEMKTMEINYSRRK